MFEKKFKVRIRHYDSGKNYCIEYAHYRFFPSYNQLQRWLVNLHCWNPVLLPYEEAKKLAKNIDSMEFISNWYSQERLLEKEYLDAVEARRKREVPVYLEEIR